jgi:hypothetical protein
MSVVPSRGANMDRSCGLHNGKDENALKQVIG